MSNSGPSNPVNETIENTTEILIPRSNSPGDISSVHLSQTQVNAFSGAMAGFTAAVVVCPLDVAKTRSQAQGAYLKSFTPEINNVYEQYKYKGILHSLKLISKEEGVRGLYRGLIPMTLGYFPTWMIYFACYEKFKRVYSSVIKDENLSYCLSAMSAGAISSTFTNPIWVIKTRLMLQIGDGKTIYDRFPKFGASGAGPIEQKQDYYKGVIDAFKKMNKHEGIKSFYNGLLPSYFGLIHVAIQFPLYENLKKILKVVDPKSPTKEPSFSKLLLASTLSKMIASAITYPHEIVRTRLQIVKTGPDGSSTNSIKSLKRVIKSIYYSEGLKGFYSGFVINLSRTVPASAVTLISFEYFRTYFEKFADDDNP